MQIGDCVLSDVDDHRGVTTVVDRIVRVERHLGGRGVYAPVTPSGTLVVAGVHTSAYAQVENHRVMHMLITLVNVIMLVLAPFADWLHRTADVQHWHQVLLAVYEIVIC